MKDLDNIRYVFILRLGDGKNLLQAGGEGKNEEAKIEFEKKVKPKLLLGDLSSGQRKKIKSPKIGIWYTLCDENMTLFTIGTLQSYKERLANQFLDVKQKFPKY